MVSHLPTRAQYGKPYQAADTLNQVYPLYTTFVVYLTNIGVRSHYVEQVYYVKLFPIF